VFAETYVCSWLNLNNAIITAQFTRTASGFQQRGNVSEHISYSDIVYEDFKVIVLHRTTSLLDNDNFTTNIVQIEKTGQQRFTVAFLLTRNEVVNLTFEGTCTVVE